MLFEPKEVTDTVDNVGHGLYLLTYTVTADNQNSDFVYEISLTLFINLLCFLRMFGSGLLVDYIISV